MAKDRLRNSDVGELAAKRSKTEERAAQHGCGDAPVGHTFRRKCHICAIGSGHGQAEIIPAESLEIKEIE